MVRTVSILILWALSVLSAAGAGIDTSTRIFDPHFRTLKLQMLDNFMSPPVIRMGTEDVLIVNFDEIGEDNSFLEYRLIHCNADWQPSRLVESEYIDGFNSQRIEDYAFSNATFVHYTNYRIEIPNPDMRIKHSGNYLLQVYNPDDPDTVILQARFRISENFSAVTGALTSRTDRGYNSEWQQLALSVSGEGLDTFNPYQDLWVEVEQNMRPETHRVLRAAPC